MIGVTAYELPTRGAGGAGAEEAPGETAYVSYIFALLCTEFTNDKSGYVIYHKLICKWTEACRLR